MASPIETGRYLRAVDLAKEYNIEIEMTSTNLGLKNSEGTFLGYFYNTDEMYYYMLGYQSGQMDSFVHKAEQNN